MTLIVDYNCETNIDECASTPCQNSGTCTDYVNYYLCTCVDGFIGKSVVVTSPPALPRVVMKHSDDR